MLSLITISIADFSPPSKLSMILPVITTIKDMKEKNRTKMKIGVESIVNEKVGDMKYNERDVRRRRMRK